jgi:hypothetical protein
MKLLMLGSVTSLSLGVVVVEVGGEGEEKKKFSAKRYLGGGGDNSRLASNLGGSCTQRTVQAATV